MSHRHRVMWLCCLLLGCDSGNGTCPVPEVCSTKSCCGSTFTTCARCVDGTWFAPEDDDCYFACSSRCEPSAAFDGPCAAPPKKTAETVCTDAALDELMTCIGPELDAARCAAIKAAAPACATCVLSTWWSPTGGPDEAACVARFDPTCGQATQCTKDCTVAVCRACGDAAWTHCSFAAQQRSGPCATQVAARDACVGKAPTCFVRAPGDLRRFLGAVCGGASGDAGAETDVAD